MFALRVPYALLLGVVAFFMEFIPILGVFISGALCVLIALTQGLLTALLVAIYFVVVHVIEGDLVGPRVMGQAVGVHPAVALLALVGGTELFGLWGALFGAPLAGLVQSVATAVWREVRIASPAFPDEPAKPRTRNPRRTSTQASAGQ
jgi:predicted PurR-regulated permease PerM